MAIDAFVLAGLPTMERVVHEVAVQAELGIVLGIIVQVQGADTHDHNHQPDHKTDHDFKFNANAII